MIPAKITCPASWTLEYAGYLMAEYYNHKNNVVYECVDKDAEAVPGSGASIDVNLCKSYICVFQRLIIIKLTMIIIPVLVY